MSDEAPEANAAESGPARDEKPNGVEWSSVAGIATAGTGLISAIGALAVTGVLQKLQRNHPLHIGLALGLTVAAAGIWVLDAIWGSRTTSLLSSPGRVADDAEKRKELPDWLTKGVDRVGVFVRGALQPVAVVLFVGALIIGFVAVITTQRDSERPDIDAQLDSRTKTLSATVRVHNVASDGRLLILINGYPTSSNERAGSPTSLEQTKTMFQAIIGPDSTGTIERAVSYDFEENSADLEAVGVIATLGSDANCHYSAEVDGAESATATMPLPLTSARISPPKIQRKNIKQSLRAACVIIRLPDKVSGVVGGGQGFDAGPAPRGS